MKTEEVNTEDQRYALAEEAIFGALNQLARKKPIDRITVSDIIRRAGIVRSTFYNHYQDMPSLLEAAEQRMQSEIFDLRSSGAQTPPTSSASPSRPFMRTRNLP